MHDGLFREILYAVSVFYVIYLIIFSAFSFLAIIIGAYKLHFDARMRKFRNKMEYDDLPVSIIVPAYNESVSIVKSVHSLLELDYRLYEIVIVDDGSKDGMAEKLIEEFDMKHINRPISLELECNPSSSIHENIIKGVPVTLIRKINGGKGDALNMGINASRYPYFICMDADSKLQKDSLKEIVVPLIEDDTVIAVGGLILISQCVRTDHEGYQRYILPPNLLVGLQAVEYNRSFLASRILMDTFNGNLIISGAFGLFKKSTVVAAGGYSSKNLGEDMELVLKLHGFCRNNDIKYRMNFRPSALCMTQAPMRLKDLTGQRRRWHIGLLQCMFIHRRVMLNMKFGLVSFFSYLYYLLYELFAPVIEFLGIFSILLALYMDILNVDYMILFMLIYALFGAIISLSAFSQKIYTQRFRISLWEMVKTFFLCVIEFAIFRYFLVAVRFMSFLSYRKNKGRWGKIKRV